MDYNETDIWNRFEELGFAQNAKDRSIIVDTSDDIRAAYIIERLNTKSDGVLVVVDYPQLLDQRRTNPPVEQQVHALKKFATESGAIVILISQIDRSFDLSPSDMPSLDDVRLPNPVDLSIFGRRCFLHDSEVQIENAA